MQKKELERKKKHRDLIKDELRKYSVQRGRGGRGRGRGRGGYFAMGNYGSFNSNWSAMDRNEMRRQETLDKARLEQMRQRVSTVNIQ